MKPKSRFIKSVLETARKHDTELPWSRGPRREDFVARRRAEPGPARQGRTV